MSKNSWMIKRDDILTPFLTVIMMFLAILISENFTVL